MQKLKVYGSSNRRSVPDDFGTSDWLKENCWNPRRYPADECYAVFEVYAMKDSSYFVVITGSGISDQCDLIIVKNSYDLIEFLNGFVPIIELKHKEYLRHTQEEKTYE